MIALSIPLWVVQATHPVALLPGLPVSALQALCPGLAAALLVFRKRGAAGVKALLARVVDWHRVPSAVWYLPALLLAPLLAVLSYWILRAMDVPLPEPRFPIGALPAMAVGFLVSALGEEIGWSGYILEPSQGRWGELGAGVVLGLMWAAWHLVALVQVGRSAEWIAWWCLGTVGSRVILVWLYNRAGRSVFVTALHHMASNVSWQLFPNNGSHYDPRTTSLLVVSAAALVTLLPPRSDALRRSS